MYRRNVGIAADCDFGFDQVIWCLDSNDKRVAKLRFRKCVVCIICECTQGWLLDHVHSQLPCKAIDVTVFWQNPAGTVLKVHSIQSWRAEGTFNTKSVCCSLPETHIPKLS
jgi:hypothetical protein